MSRLFATTPTSDNITGQDTLVSDTLAGDTLAGASSLKHPFLVTLRDRGYLHQCTNLLALDATLTSQPTFSAYLGFDATAPSLHVGSLLQIMILRHLQKSGCKPIVLVGGATTKIGDPTGKDESRKMLSDEDIQRNIDGLSGVFGKFIDFNESENGAVLVNNNDWFEPVKYLEFLRDFGTYFTINRMLSFESVKQRMSRENPLTFLEFNYMILQSVDFLELNQRYGAQLQLGGSDQWGNIVSGCELTRRKGGETVFGLTAPLIQTSDGRKMGKTEGGAIWLNADKLSPYDYWQFWRNTNDDDVIQFMKLFTELDLDRIGEMEKWAGSELNAAKIILADEATTLLHGGDCLEDIHRTAQSMFENKNAVDVSLLPRVSAPPSVKVVDALIQLGFASSKKEAKRLIAGGGCKIGEDKVADEGAELGGEAGEEIVLRAGKKRAGVVVLQ